MADTFIEFAQMQDSSWQWVIHIGMALLQVGVLFGIVLVAAAAFTWAERKVSARIQDRLGPTRRGGRFGWLQAPADGGTKT